MGGASSYLVTGGMGFIGSALARRLVSEGHRVRILDNGARGRAARLSGVAADIEFVDADIRDADAVRRAAQGIERVCHLAYVNGTAHFYRQPGLVLDVGVRGMLNVLDACKAAGVADLLLVSSSEVYQTPPRIPTDETVPLSIPDPTNPRYSYAAGKIISEVLALHGADGSIKRVVIARPHNVYGPDMGAGHVVPQFILRMKALADSLEDPVPFPIQGSGKETRAFVFIDDCVDGLMTLLAAGGHEEIYHVGNPEEITIAALAEQVGAFFGKRIQVIAGPLAEGSTLRRSPDIRKLAALGYSPKTPIQKGIEITARWYAEHSRDYAESQPEWQYAAAVGG